MLEFLQWKCLDIPRPVGAALGLLVIVIGVSIQLVFLSVQLVQGIVFALLMPMAPLALSWVVNHLYATPVGKVHVWVFHLYQRFSGVGQHHSQGTRTDLKGERGQRYAVHTIACLLDNYCYLVVDQMGEPPFACCVIDVSDAEAVMGALREIAVTQYGGRGIKDRGKGDGGGGDDGGDNTSRLSAGAANVAERGAGPPGVSARSAKDAEEEDEEASAAVLLESLKGLDVSDALPVDSLKDLVSRANRLGRESDTATTPTTPTTTTTTCSGARNDGTGNEEDDAVIPRDEDLVTRAQDARAKLVRAMEQRQQERLERKRTRRRQEAVWGLDGFSDVLRLDCVLSTHKHWDHTCGNAQMLKLNPDCNKVYGSRLDKVPACTHLLDDGDVVTVGSLSIVALHTPCHTRGSLCFQVKGCGQSGGGHLEGAHIGCMFTGDTLFCGGCGAPFEGMQSGMHKAFQRIWYESGSEHTLLFPGHDYAEVLMPQYFSNGSQFPLPSHPQDFRTLTSRYWEAVRFRRRRRALPLPAVPVSLGVEMAFNANFAPLHDAADCVSAALRRMALVHFEAHRTRAQSRSVEQRPNSSSAHRERSSSAEYSSASRNDNKEEEEAEEEGSDLLPGGKRRVYLTVPLGAVAGHSLEFDTGDGRTASIAVPKGSRPGDRIPVNLPAITPTQAAAAAPSSLSSSPPLRNPSTKPPFGSRLKPRALSSAKDDGDSDDDNDGDEGGQSPRGEEGDDDEEVAASNYACGEDMGSDGTAALASREKAEEPKRSPLASSALSPSSEGAKEGEKEEEKGSAVLGVGGAPSISLVDDESPADTTASDRDETDHIGDSDDDGDDFVFGGGGGDDKSGGSGQGFDFAGIGEGGGGDDESAGSSAAWHAAAFSETDYGAAYGFEVTMATLVSSLHALSGGKDRLDLKTLFRALTTLGSRKGTGASGRGGTNQARTAPWLRFEKRNQGNDGDRESNGEEEERSSSTWRGMAYEEAAELIDGINLPQQVLLSSYDDYAGSTETLVVEYLASILAAACDPERRSSPAPSNGFLATLLRCCSCCPPPGRRKKQRPASKKGNRKGQRGHQKVRVDSHDTTTDEEGSNDRDAGVLEDEGDPVGDAQKTTAAEGIELTAAPRS